MEEETRKDIQRARELLVSVRCDLMVKVTQLTVGGDEKAHIEALKLSEQYGELCAAIAILDRLPK